MMLKQKTRSTRACASIGFRSCSARCCSNALLLHMMINVAPFASISFHFFNFARLRNNVCSRATLTTSLMASLHICQLLLWIYYWQGWTVQTCLLQSSECKRENKKCVHIKHGFFFGKKLKSTCLFHYLVSVKKVLEVEKLTSFNFHSLVTQFLFWENRVKLSIFLLIDQVIAAIYPSN